jgi:spermidine synthase
MQESRPKTREWRWPIPALLFVGLVVFTLGVMANWHGSLLSRWRMLVPALAAIGGWIALSRTRSRWWPWLAQRLEEHTQALDNLPERRIGLWIALAAGLGLYLELMIIRWHASCFQVFAYFKNISLLACFLGLGIGYAHGPRRPVLTPLVLPAIALQFAALYALRFSSLQSQLNNPVAEQLTLGLQTGHNFRQLAIVYGFLIMLFVFNALCFVPLGHLAARLMLRTGRLVAYSWNLVGSLAGIALFTGLSFLWAPPAAWLVVGAAGVLAFLWRARRSLVIPSVASVAVALAVLAAPFDPTLLDVYSPYQIISCKMMPDEPTRLQVNHVYYQRMVDLSGRVKLDYRRGKDAAFHYNFPYWLMEQPDDVLVVGAGTGNDVAAALRHGAHHIDAVEIDPAILYYGRKLHPEQPYADARVHAIINDARSFMRHTDRRYDLIVYGLLDSHTLLSTVSNVRLDSFIYTVEAIQEARKLLKKDGMLALTFCVLSEPLAKKLYLMVKDGFDGQEPHVFRAHYDGGYTFFDGPYATHLELDPELAKREVTAALRESPIKADVSTDDWPFLYMPVRQYPVSYVVMVVVLLVVSLLVIRQLVPGAGRGFSLACFFLGIGFMLVETKGITELGLTFGNTWHVIAAVIAGILLMAFLANLLRMHVKRVNLVLNYGLLAGVLVLGLLLPERVFGAMPVVVAKVARTALLTVPLFFSGLAFSSELAVFATVDVALASNLLGSMTGGLIEYNSMYFGFHALYLFALAFYAMAFGAALLRRRAARAAASASPQQTGEALQHRVS